MRPRAICSPVCVAFVVTAAGAVLADDAVNDLASNDDRARELAVLAVLARPKGTPLPARFEALTRDPSGAVADAAREAWRRHHGGVRGEVGEQRPKPVPNSSDTVAASVTARSAAPKPSPRSEDQATGDREFKSGNYLKASEAYRRAVLADPTDPQKKLAFGHALFAMGNYSYASYSLRRAISEFDPNAPFEPPDPRSPFPSAAAFDTALRDLKRYVTYSPKDPAGLSVCSYILYSAGDDARAREFAVYLQRLPHTEEDPFAKFLLVQLDRRAKDKEAVAPGDARPPSAAGQK